MTVLGLLILVPVGAYLAARAVLVPLTYDEASSFARYVAAEPLALFDFASATNHLLSSALTRLSYELFGSSAIALRLPSLLAGLAYLAIVASLAAGSRHAVVGLAGLVLLVTNPYLLDYLSLSRGYGLAIALLTGSVAALARWCGQASSAAGSNRNLAFTLALAGAAVAANFAMLSPFLAITVVVIARLVWTSRTEQPREAGGVLSAGCWRLAAAWLLVTAIFTTAVFARERVLSENGSLPITMRVAGLFEDELSAIQVFRTEDTGRLRELPRRDDGTWNTGPVNDAWKLHIVLPVSVDRNLASLDVTMGAHTVRRDRQSPGPWTHYDIGSDRVLEATDAARWSGGEAHLRQVVLHTLVALGSLAVLAGGLVLAFRALVRAHRMPAAPARLLTATLLGVASVAAAPLYLLQRDGQLFFGGTTGLAHDTLGSLVSGTLYQTGAEPALTLLAFVGFALLAAALAAAIWLRPADRATLVPAAAVLAVIAIVLIQVAVQHRAVGTPYPMARTAIYLLPLSLVFLMLAADALATLGRVAARMVTAAMVLLAIASAWNGVRAANTSRALDWAHDAATPAMLDVVARTEPRAGIIRVGVDWFYYPAARYYADRLSTGATRYEVVVLPGDGLPFDFVYGPPASESRQGAQLRAFPETGAALYRGR
jgi:hypothetical protein